MLTDEQRRQHVSDNLKGGNLVLGEKDARLPVWPIYRQSGAATAGTAQHPNAALANAGTPQLVGWLFESVDIEPVRGYSGKPINLLITLTPTGEFMDVRLIQHYEPIFQSASATQELVDFASQYDGLTINHDIQIFSATSKPSRDETTASLHGVLRGTVSAVAIGHSIMSAAVRVIDARLDDPDAKVVHQARSGRNERYQRQGWSPLVDVGLIQRIELTNRQVERAFRKTPAVRRDATAIMRPGGLTVDAWLTPIGLPQAGRNILSPTGWEQVRSARRNGSQVFLAMDSSRYPLVGEVSAKANRVAKLSVRQGDQVFDLEAMPFEHRLRLTGRGSGVSSDAVARLFHTRPGSGFDLVRDFDVIVEPVRQADGPVAVAFEQSFTVPGIAELAPVLETPQWLKVWQQRSVEIVILVIGLAVLTIVLPMQRRLVRLRGGLPVFRYFYLIFTLGFIGWYAQGQLTIVNITSLLEAFASGQSAEFLLADPMAVILWCFVLVTLFIWGRGTFCGWLCPFGAFQELISRAANRLGWRQKPLKVKTDRALKRLKYLILAAILAMVFISGAWTERIIEIEPFKTAISMSFQRAWPYVLWAVACLALSLVAYRGYCRYLCPLGAGLAVLGRVRLFSWIPRRDECGTPCQTCRYRCGYQAIAPTGKVDYAECFQCLDCVSIHQNVRHCLPLIRERKGRLQQPVVIGVRPT